MVPNEPSPKEFSEMENEARLRLLKSEKVWNILFELIIDIVTW